MQPKNKSYLKNIVLLCSGSALLHIILGFIIDIPYIILLNLLGLVVYVAVAFLTNKIPFSISRNIAINFSIVFLAAVPILYGEFPSVHLYYLLIPVAFMFLYNRGEGKKFLFNVIKVFGVYIFIHYQYVYGEPLIEVNPLHERFLHYFTSANLFLISVGLAYIYWRNNNTIQLELFNQKEQIELQQSSLKHKNHILKQLNEDKNLLLGVVAHDLRTPVNQIKALINLINITPRDNQEKHTEYLSKMVESTDRLKLMINRILDVNAIESGSINLKYEDVNVSALIKQVILSLDEMARQKEIKVKYASHNDIVNIKIDKNYLIQILENLLSNAIKFSFPKTEVTIFTEISSNGYIDIKVQDEGPGVSKNDLKYLFSPFQKLSARPTANEKSTGLGLVIVKKYTEAMGGIVTCNGEVSCGSEFSVQFPINI